MSVERRTFVCLVAGALLSTAALSRADEPPPVKVGTTIFTELAWLAEPATRDAAGRDTRASAFDVTRAYVNLTADLSPRVSLRVTPDLRRLVTTSRNLEAGSSVTTSADGSALYRLKYAYGHVGLDGVAPAGSWLRFGAHPTPFLDFTDSVYRYRFQGTLAAEREGLLSSSDFGVSTRFVLPSDAGDLHVGVYNGESYSRAEVDGRKSLQTRLSLRPFARNATLKGLRLTGFHVADSSAGDAPRRRSIASATWEHPRLNAGFDVVRALDRPSGSDVRTRGTSAWLVPKLPSGIEVLLRRDAFDDDSAGSRQRLVAGLAWWLVRRPPATAAVLLDVERLSRSGNGARPAETRVTVHWLLQR